MIKFNPTARRGYAAAAASIALVLLNRYIVSHEWAPFDVFLAFVSDVIILSCFFIFYMVVDFFLEDGAITKKINVGFHLLFVLAVAALSAGAMALFFKTGEELDFGIVSFFLANFFEMKGAVGAAVDYDVVSLLFAILVIYTLSLLQVKSRALKFVQYFLLFLPVLLIPICIIFGDVVGNAAIGGREEIKGKYNGIYQDLTGFQQGWIDSGAVPAWRKGILTGLTFNGALSSAEYNFAASKIKKIEKYQAPIFVAATKTKPNFLLITLESTRADVVGAYGLNSRTSVTPFLDSMAKNGVLIENAYTTVPHTSKALVGVFCGTFPAEGLLPDEVTTNTRLNCLPNLLDAAGYKTAHFQTAPGQFEERIDFLKGVGFQYYVTQENLRRSPETIFGYLGLDDRLLLEPSLSWMKEQQKNGKPFFASILTILTHHPYVSPGNNFPISNAKEAYRGYLKSAQYNDGVLKELITKMENEGLLKNTVIIITGDHGEAFGEHGQLAHNGSSYEEGMRVPLVFYNPAILGAVLKVSGLRQHIDIMPTVLNMAGVQYQGLLPGKDLLHNSEGHESVITSCFYSKYCLAYYEKTGKKLIYFYGRRKAEVFDLKKDMHEKNNIVDSVGSEKINDMFVNAVRQKESYEAVYK